ncbi:MAG: polyprenyl synthetase family protein, partial [Jatrophihabitantaceae bacterium]
MSRPEVVRTPPAIARTRELVAPALRSAVDAIPDENMRRVASYQLGWCDAAGNAVEGGGGKMIRPTLAVLSAEAVGANSAGGVPGGVALELVHNFSLLHDDIMDGDTERRHRATGWVAFGEGQAILGGSAMLTAAVQVLGRDTASASRTVPYLLDAVQQLISGQSADLTLERQEHVELDEVLRMEVGKTAALLSCSASIGAVAAGAAASEVKALAEYGHSVGVAFQLVDDVLGVIGDPSVTGKSASSDLRVGKSSAVIVAAMRAGTPESGRLVALLQGGPPKSEDEVALVTSLIIDAGGVRWALAEADRLLDQGRHERDLVLRLRRAALQQRHQPSGLRRPG